MTMARACAWRANGSDIDSCGLTEQKNLIFMIDDRGCGAFA
jgi:hypothetical protein